MLLCNSQNSRDGGFFHCIIILCDYKAIQTEPWSFKENRQIWKFYGNANDDNDAFLIVVCASSWNIVNESGTNPDFIWYQNNNGRDISL